MAIQAYNGKFQTMWFKKVASTAFTLNDLVYVDTNGYLTPAVDGASFTPIGLIQKTIAASDSTNDFVPVLVGDVDAEYVCDVTTGTAAQTDVGEWVDIDDAKNIDVNAVTYKVFFVTKILSTTKVIAKLAKLPTGAAGTSGYSGTSGWSGYSGV